MKHYNEWQPGDRIKRINGNNNTIKNNEIYLVDKIESTSVWVKGHTASSDVKNFIWVGPEKPALETYQEEIATKKQEIQELEARIAFMEETGATEFDSKLYTVYNSLKVMDNASATTIEKAKAITELIKTIK